MVPILTYHSWQREGTTRERNDHIALAADLKVLSRLGLRTCSVLDIVACLFARGGDLSPVAGCVALSCDDGANWDFRDDGAATDGSATSLRRVLAASSGLPGMERAHRQLTCFVIASREARRLVVAQSKIPGLRLDSQWWRWARLGCGWEIGNHTWDHQHPAIYGEAAERPVIATEAVAAQQVARAQRAIGRAMWPFRPRLFAYPYGTVSAYLRDEYFPRHAESLGLRAAFTSEPAPVSRGVDRWAIPRYVQGHHWHNEDELVRLLGR